MYLRFVKLLWSQFRKIIQVGFYTSVSNIKEVFLMFRTRIAYCIMLSYIVCSSHAYCDSVKKSLQKISCVDSAEVEPLFEINSNKTSGKKIRSYMLTVSGDMKKCIKKIKKKFKKIQIVEKSKLSKWLVVELNTSCLKRFSD